MTLFIMALLSILAFCHTWLHFATHSYTCSFFSFLLLIGLLLDILCLQNWFIDMTLLIMALLSILAFCHTWLHRQPSVFSSANGQSTRYARSTEFLGNK